MTMADASNSTLAATLSDEARREFANAVLPEWLRAMDQFFAAVDTQREARGLNESQTHTMLVAGYGSDVADEWLDWSEEDN